VSDSVAQFWMEGGWWMFPIALLGCSLVPATLMAFILGLTSKKASLVMPLAIGLLCVGLLPAVLGEAGFLSALRTVDEALMHVNPQDAATIRAAGRSEALTTIIFGLWTSLVPTFGGAVLLGLALMRRATSAEASPRV
jgi:hypothetical protein